MQIIQSILIGVAIGVQMTTIYYTIRIMQKRLISTLPYLLIAISIFLTTITRIDNFVLVLSLFQRTLILTVASVLMYLAFRKLWLSVKKI